VLDLSLPRVEGDSETAEKFLIRLDVAPSDGFCLQVINIVLAM
jgi:hypothetical protein